MTKFICNGVEKNGMQIPCVPCVLSLDADAGMPKRCPYNLEYTHWEIVEEDTK